MIINEQLICHFRVLLHYSQPNKAKSQACPSLPAGQPTVQCGPDVALVCVFNLQNSSVPRAETAAETPIRLKQVSLMRANLLTTRFSKSHAFLIRKHARSFASTSQKPRR